MAGGRIDIEVAPDLRGFDQKLGTGLKRSTGAVAGIVKGLGVAVATSTTLATVGLKQVVDVGREYEANLNELQAVSGATAVEMAKVGQVAKDLGSDMSLPATSAADAAAAMVELTKGGLSVAESMKAAKGTLQLAAAAQIDAATAAEIQSSQLNAFALSADQAGRVADVLANTSNAAAGSIVDIGNSLKYVAPVSAALKVSLEDTAAAIGLLANQGVKGEQAGTSLRGILASLASPSAAARDALRDLGVQAFDNQGKFIGLRKFTDQLAQAKKRLSDADFAAAASTAFGNEGFTAANALAAEGAVAFDQMAASVSRTGGAADVAAAKTKGLGGAIEGFNSQVETAGIEIYEVIAPPLERAVRAAASFVERFTPTVVGGLQTAVSAGELFGPALADALAAKGSAVADVAGDVLEPLADGIKDSLNSAVNLGITVFGGFTDVVQTSADAVGPLAEGVGDLIESINEADGPVGAVAAGLELIYDATTGVIHIISPLVGIVGTLASGFADLPGPIQTAALALLALKVGPAILGGLTNMLRGTAREAGEAGRQTGLLGRTMGTVLAPVRAVGAGLSGAAIAVRQFNDEARVQRAVAAGAGQEVGRLASHVAAFNTSTIPAVASARGFRDQTLAIRDAAAGAGQPIGTMTAAIGTLVERSPALSQMRDSFHNAADGAQRFGRVAGTAAAAGTGLKLAAGGLVGALGGPMGVAIAGAVTGLSLLAGANERAAAEERAHQDQVDQLATALRDNNGVIDDRIKALAFQRLEEKGAIDSARELGIPIDQLTQAYLGNKGAIDQVIGALDGYIAQVEGQGQMEGQVAGQNPLADKAFELRGILLALLPEMAQAEQKNRELGLAIASGRASMVDATDSGRSFAAAMGVLADNTASADDKSRALKQALDALSGGQIDLESAQARLNEGFDRMKGLFDTATAGSKGFVASLVTTDGRFNIATENGRRFRDSLQGISEEAITVAQRTHDMTGSVDQAKEVIVTARQRFIDTAVAMGIGAAQAGKLADQMGLVPNKVATLIETPGMGPAQQEMVLLKEKILAVPKEKPVFVKALTEDAKARLEALGVKITKMPNGEFRIDARTTAADNAIRGIVRRWNGYTIHLNTSVRGGGRNLQQLGGGLGGAVGGIVHGYAYGGIHKLTPMRGGIAQRVPANSWRVIGDRVRGDEFYLPDDEAPRTMAIGREWARRRGLLLVKAFATGGIAGVGPTTTAASESRAPVTVNMPITVQDNRSAAEVAQVASSEVAWLARFSR